MTDVAGEVVPAVELFQELEAGAELAISAGGRLTLEHYASCELATVTGGTVGVDETGLDLDRATVAGRAESSCAKAVALQQGESVAASVVLRGVGPPSVPLAPEIVIAGGGAGFEVMRVERDGGEIAMLSVRAGRVEWPEGGLFLSDRTVYMLVLEGPTGEHRARVMADRDATGRTVLRP